VAAGHDERAGNTFTDASSADETPGIRIDYAFVDKSMRQQVLKAWIDETAQGSDHQPYWIELDYAPMG